VDIEEIIEVLNQIDFRIDLINIIKMDKIIEIKEIGIKMVLILDKMPTKIITKKEMITNSKKRNILISFKIQMQ